MGRPLGSKNRKPSAGGPIIGFGPDGKPVVTSPVAAFDNGDGGTADGDGDGGNPGDSAGGSGADGAAPERKRRGRPPGAGRSQTKAEIQADVKGIEALLLSLHGMASFFTKVPELAITEQEASMLATGLMNVKKHYPDVEVLDSKQLAWAQLFGVALGVYGTRFVAITANRKRQKARETAQVPPNVVNYKRPMPDGQFPAAPQAG